MVAEDPECCPGAHATCWMCLRVEHHYGRWTPQPAFAFEERVCACCGHAEGRVLPLGEERV